MQGLAEFVEYPRALARFDNYKVHAIAAGRPGEPLQACVDGVQVHRVPVEKVKHNSVHVLYFLRGALRYLESFSFDLIHVYYYRASFLFPLLARNQRAIWITDARQGNDRSERVRNLANWLSGWESYFFDAALFVHDDLRRNMLGQRRADRTFVVPPGVNTTLFTPLDASHIRAQYGLEDNFVLLYLGTLDASRQIVKLVRYFADLARSNPKCRLMLVGKGNDEANIKQLADQLGIAQQIILAGEVPYCEVPYYLNAADLLVSYFPTAQEYYSRPLLKTLEFLSCGKPTLATNTRGNRIFIHDGLNGLLMEDDPASFVRAAKRVMGNPDFACQLAANARETALEHSWDRIVARDLIPIYEGLFAQHRQGSE